MKTFLAAALLALSLSCCVGPDGKRSFPPVKAKVCYDTPQGSICVGTDGKAIVLESNLKNGVLHIK